jgi:hypothetical protein
MVRQPFIYIKREALVKWLSDPYTKTYVFHIYLRGATQKFPKFECRAKTACSTVVGL